MKLQNVTVVACMIRIILPNQYHYLPQYIQYDINPTKTEGLDIRKKA